MPNAQYVFDLWLAHGITAVREPGCFINAPQLLARVRDTVRAERERRAAVFAGGGSVDRL